MSKRKTFGRYLTELLIVAFGVFLGLFVNEWNTNKTNNINAVNTLNLVIEEINSNITQLEYSIKYHKKLNKNIDSLVNTLNEEDKSIGYYRNHKFRYNTSPMWNGLGFANMESIVFESSKLNGVLQQFNIKTTKEISRIYSYQDNYLKFGDKLEERLLSINSETKVIDVISIFERLQYDVSVNEEWLLNQLIATKLELEKTKHNNGYK